MGDFDQAPRDSVSALIFELVMVSDGRTTDLLETIVNDSLTPMIIRQEVMQPSIADLNMIYRESVLLDSFGTAISHNFVFLKPEFMPKDLLDELLQENKPIGKIIKKLNVFSRRTVKSSGWRSPDETINLKGTPVDTQFSKQSTMVPYKTYSVHFSGYEESGMELLEYFNPKLVECYLRSRDMSLTELEKVR
ncbi:hypothetical protein [Paenibacillus sp. L3-i20]|uniref:hypothetical protein n=1 Tax=Paenibacillus sp. L3-i20 TaxID=2905833 RepID=UPI001EE04A67|nr:hypothetical protein [Paenibacillus sp. L3-i20]GKU77243.1 hypothetical protein L3i20_v216400 [Paenibacillus sp. L3-i20]